MANVDDAQKIRRATMIERCPVVQTNVRWPVPVDQRLNELLDQLAGAGTGGEITRSRLLAALVASAPTEADTLDDMLRRYRLLTAGGVVLQPSGAIRVPSRRPGRRGIAP